MIRRALGHPLGPVALAALLALVSLPLTVHLIAGARPPDAPQLTEAQAWIGSVGAVLAGALVGGGIGGLLLRGRHPFAAVFVTVLIGWPAAIVGFTVGPALTGQAFRVGDWGIDAPEPALVVGTVGLIPSSLGAYLKSILLVPFVPRYDEFLYPGFAISAVAMLAGVVAPALARVASLRLFGLVVAVVMLGWVNAWSIVASGGAWFILVGGVGLWTATLSWADGLIAVRPRWPAEEAVA